MLGKCNSLLVETGGYPVGSSALAWNPFEKMISTWHMRKIVNHQPLPTTTNQALNELIDYTARNKKAWEMFLFQYLQLFVQCCGWGHPRFYRRWLCDVTWSCFCCRAGSKSIPRDFLLGLHASMHPKPASMVLGIFHRFNVHGSMMFTQSKMFLEGATNWKPFPLSQPVNDIWNSMLSN